VNHNDLKTKAILWVCDLDALVQDASHFDVPEMEPFCGSGDEEADPIHFARREADQALTVMTCPCERVTSDHHQLIS
jgi:hypothetical protein